MKITKLTYKDGTKLTQKSLESVADRIVACAAAKGFITASEVLNSSAIKVGLHMRSFAIDVNKLGYNARWGQYHSKKSSKGYKRTDVPIWEQREDFNHVVNDVLDAFDMSANIKSGQYIVRDKKTGRINEWGCIDRQGQPAEPDRMYNMVGNLLVGMCREKEIKEHIDVDAFKTEYSVRAKERARATMEARKLRISQLCASEEIYIKNLDYRAPNKYQRQMDKPFTPNKWKQFIAELPRGHKRYFVWETKEERLMRMLHN